MLTPTQLLEAIRKEALPGLWSKGVSLARGGSVALESKTDAEVVLRVKTAGRPVPMSAVLYPGDEVWECSCSGHFDPCEHVVAAAIFWQQLESGEVKAERVSWKRVLYRFTKDGASLKVSRAIVDASGHETPLGESLAALLARPRDAALVQIEQHDLAADRILSSIASGRAIPHDRLEGLLTALEPSRTVLLEGRPVAIAPERIAPLATLTDAGDGVLLTVTKDPRVSEVVIPGLARLGDALHRMVEMATSGPSYELLPKTKQYPAAQLGELGTTTLPDLARRLNVDVKSKRVPRVDRELEPRIVLELNKVEGGLSVLPTLVYGAPPSVRIDGGKMVWLGGAVPLRDEPREQKLVHQLREAVDLVPGRRTTVAGPEMVRFADRLRGWRGGLTGDAAGVLSPKTSLTPTLALSTTTDAFGVPRVTLGLDFHVEGGQGDQRVDGAEVVRAWREGAGLVPLLGGGWAPVPVRWLEQHGQKVADLLAARGDDGALQNHALPQLSQLCEALESPPPPGLDQLAPLVEGFEQVPVASLPADLTATLRPYQHQGVSWLSFLQKAGLGGVLADDMGLGKTLQTICVLGPKSLVVCPASVLPNWQRELARFRPQLKVSTYHGPGRALDDEADVTLTTYAIARLDGALLAAKAWRTVVLDEAQAIKNPDSQVARAAYGLNASFKLALSGTPVENRLDELWSLTHFTNRGLLGGRKQFDEKWAKPIEDGRAGVAQALRAKLKPFVLRRLKREVATELPPRTEAVLPVTLETHERAVYDAVLAATKNEVVALLSSGGNVLKALEALLRLRQAACHVGLIPGQHAQTSSKVGLLVERLTTAVADGHKALVFSQWTSLLDRIEPELQAAGIPFERLDGSTADRGGVTERFQSEGGAPVMLISLKAGGTGLNLTAADHVFLVDPWWNPAVEAQAADRAHRIGQERPVTVYRLVAQGTVEEKILELQEKKRALFEAALGEGGGGASLTKDDLLALFD